MSRICLSWPTSVLSAVTSFCKHTERLSIYEFGSACGCQMDGVSPVAAGLYVSVPQLSSPATTPKVSSSACSGWLPHGCVPGTSASSHRGPALLSSCGARRLPLQRCCSSHLLALHAGSFLGAGGESGASPATSGEQNRVVTCNFTVTGCRKKRQNCLKSYLRRNRR